MNTNPYRLTAEQQALASSCIRLAYQLAGRFAARGLDREACEDAALDGLMRAAALFDPARGVRFTTYAHPAITNTLIHYQKMVSRSPHVRFFSELATAVDGELLPFEPMDTRARAASGGSALALACVREVLPPRWWRMLVEYYLEGGTLAEVGARHQLSTERVRQLLAKAVRLARHRVPAFVEGEPVGPLQMYRCRGKSG